MNRHFHALAPTWLILAAGLGCAVQAVAQPSATAPRILRLGKINAAPLDDACLDGYQHRRATANDWVCVTAETAEQAQVDNQAAASRKSPGGGPYGADTCKSGFVWRGVTPADHVCVTPNIRNAVALDNSANAGRKKKPWCEQYMQHAMASVVDAAASACAPSDASLWSRNPSDHQAFCMQHPQTASNQASQARTDDLKACKEAARQAADAAASRAAESAKAEADRASQAAARAGRAAAAKASEAAAARKKEEDAAAKARQEAADKARAAADAQAQARNAANKKCDQNMAQQFLCLFKSADSGSASAPASAAASDPKKTASK